MHRPCLPAEFQGIGHRSAGRLDLLFADAFKDFPDADPGFHIVIGDKRSVGKGCLFELYVPEQGIVFCKPFCGQVDRGNDFPVLQAVVDMGHISRQPVEFQKHDPSFSVRSTDVDRGVKCRQHHAYIRGKYGNAVLALSQNGMDAVITAQG